MSSSTPNNVNPVDPAQQPILLPIDANGLSAMLMRCPVENEDSDFPGRPSGPPLQRCQEKGCFNMLLWITDDFATGLPIAAVCGHCGKSIKYPPRDPNAGKVWIDILDHGQMKGYLVRMLQWELNTTQWGRKSAEYDAAVFTVYQSFIDSYDVPEGLHHAFRLADGEWKKQGCPQPY